MAEKKNQHLVPECYLKNFIADVSDELKTNPKFKSGVYVNNELLSDKWKLRGVAHNTFTRPYYYNLEEDDPKKPIIENYLSVVESDYSKYIKEIIKGIVTNENLSFLSFYTILQFIRVEKFIDMFQESFNRVASWADMFAGGNSYEMMVKDLSKKMIATTDAGGILHPFAYILYNTTNFTFITSDTPVVRKQVNINDMLKLFPKEVLLENINESKEFTLFLFPLHPNVAYVSCELLNKDIGNKFFINNLLNIFNLNIAIVLNASKHVYSSVKEPIKGGKILSDYLKSLNNDTLIAKIYTTDKRIISEIDIVQDEAFLVSFAFKNKDNLIGQKVGDAISLFEIIKNNLSIRGMRNCYISDIKYETGFIRIESKIKFPTN